MKTKKGLVLEDRYELVSLIATGGMGEVWKGMDRELDRECAIKVLRREYAHDETFLRRFRAEARHTAALSHDAIAALYDYGETDGRAYIVMELAAGKPLSDIIEENPSGLPEERVIDVLVQLARALDAAHAKGVVHRDVKPENVLVDTENDWRVKITDFGIARSDDQARMTKTGLVMGTAQYLSPEQAMGKQATSLSDVYALGIVAYEMLVGHRPFTGATQVEIAMAQVKQQPPELPEHINADLRSLVMRTLAKAPANRPRSAAIVARALTAIERGEHPDTGGVPTHVSPQRREEGQDSASSSPAPGTASPVGTRTAAMPLPQRRGGIRHRSGASAPSALSAHSAPSASVAPSTSRTPAPVNGAGQRSASSARSAASALSGGSASSASRAPQHPSSRPTGRESGRRGPSAVILVIGALVLLGIIAAILGATGVIPLGATGIHEMHSMAGALLLGASGTTSMVRSSADCVEGEGGL